MKSFVFTGPQGSGKTTLAKHWAEISGARFAAIETKSLMPRNIKSHLDVLSMAVNEPSSGIDFQKALVFNRHALFQHNWARGIPYTSDRAVLDSYVYYSLHNSMFSDGSQEAEMYQKTKESLQFCDATILLMPELVDGTEDNGIRVSSKVYYKSFGFVMSGLLEEMSSNPNCYNLPPLQNVISDKLTVIVFINGDKNVYAFFQEKHGFSTMEDRIAGIKYVSDICDRKAEITGDYLGYNKAKLN